MTNSDNLAGYNRPQIVQTETSRLSCPKNLITFFPRRTSSDSRGKGRDVCPASCGTVCNGGARDSTDQRKWRNLHQE